MRLADALLVAVPGLPLALAVAWIVPALRTRLIALVPWTTAPAIVLCLLPLERAPSWTYSGFATGITLVLDAPGRAFLLVVAVLWAVVGAFAYAYHATDARRDVLFGFFTLTMVGNLGLVVAGDPVTFYLFFTWMTFAAYGLVVHARSDEAIRAGRVYIVLALVGELGVLGALFVLGGVESMPAFGPELDAIWASLASAGRSEFTAALVVAGFGVKAGLVPLHVWLPLAHPVAPTPASALLSGAMIKAGLIAWLRFLPSELAFEAVGTVVLVAGLGGIVYGVVIGLTQHDAKTVLAYSSISQMGFMTAGVGVWLRADGAAPVAVVAVVAYALHHAVAKTALFLSVGVADRMRASAGGPDGEAGPGASGGAAGDLPGPTGGAVGGLPGGEPVGRAAAGGAARVTHRQRASARLGPKRLLVVGAALPGLALAGAPLSSGHLSKTLLKDAMAGFVPAWPMTGYLALAAFGTTLLVMRFLVLLEARATGEAVARGAGPTRFRGWLLEPTTLAWAILLLAGALGAWWIPGLYRPEGAPPLPAFGYGWVDAALPVVLGGAIAWGIMARPLSLRAASRIRVPAGDLVVPAERLLLPLGDALSRERPLPAFGWMRRLRALVTEDPEGIARTFDLRLARGRVLGLSLLVLVFVLARLLT